MPSQAAEQALRGKNASRCTLPSTQAAEQALRGKNASGGTPPPVLFLITNSPIALRRYCAGAMHPIKRTPKELMSSACTNATVFPHSNSMTSSCVEHDRDFPHTAGRGPYFCEDETHLLGGLAVLCDSDHHFFSYTRRHGGSRSLVLCVRPYAWTRACGRARCPQPSIVQNSLIVCHDRKTQLLSRQRQKYVCDRILVRSEECVFFNGSLTPPSGGCK